MNGSGNVRLHEVFTVMFLDKAQGLTDGGMKLTFCPLIGKYLQ